MRVTTAIALSTIALLCGLVGWASSDPKNGRSIGTDSFQRVSGAGLNTTEVNVGNTEHATESRILASHPTELAEVTSQSAIIATWQSIGSGGVFASSAGRRAYQSTGQTSSGRMTSANHKALNGYQYGTFTVELTCACDCHGDPSNCDGFRNITDVVETVNCAFRNGAPIPDPNPSCPYVTTDVNCSGSTEVLDVVKMVNVTFRNGNPATEFCDPCP